MKAARFLFLGFIFVFFSCASMPVEINSLGHLSRIEISPAVYSIWFYSNTPEKSYDLAMYWAADVGIVKQYLSFVVESKDIYPIANEYTAHLVVRMQIENTSNSYNCEVIATRICSKYNIK
jgi:hypothetical protein